MVYTLPGCMACFRARRLLHRRGIVFEEFKGARDADFRETLRKRTGGSTAPQVLIDGRPVGGADHLAALDRDGILLPLIRRQQFPVVVIRPRLKWFRRYFEVRLVDADGHALETVRAGSEAEAERLSSGFRQSRESRADHRSPGER
ncbi:MAG: hypothetical protein JJE10_01960 [Thermoleophilia bacterium]|nr:hypothetical protein [Thermoleophilia bacterium]